MVSDVGAVTLATTELGEFEPQLPARSIPVTVKVLSLLAAIVVVCAQQHVD
jgi:hypothetical protein